MGGYGPSPQERGTDLSCRGGYRPLPSTVATPTFDRREEGSVPPPLWRGPYPLEGSRCDSPLPGRGSYRRDCGVGLSVTPPLKHTYSNEKERRSKKREDVFLKFTCRAPPYAARYAARYAVHALRLVVKTPFSNKTIPKPVAVSPLHRSL